MPSPPNTSAPGYCKTNLHSVLLLLFLIVLALLPPLLPYQQQLNSWDLTIRMQNDPLQHHAFHSIQSTWQRGLLEAHLQQKALWQTLVGPSWMDELSGNPFYAKRPRLPAASEGKDIGFCRVPSKRVSHASAILKVGLKIGGISVWRNSIKLPGDYRLHLWECMAACTWVCVGVGVYVSTQIPRNSPIQTQIVCMHASNCLHASCFCEKCNVKIFQNTSLHILLTELLLYCSFSAFSFNHSSLDYFKSYKIIFEEYLLWDVHQGVQKVTTDSRGR